MILVYDELTESWIAESKDCMAIHKSRKEAFRLLLVLLRIGRQHSQDYDCLTTEQGQ